jgi:hypothetical protein
MGRKEHDVFVLGDETLVVEPSSTPDEDLVGYTTTPDDRAESAESHEYVVAPTTTRNRVAPTPRRLAVLGLGAGAVTVFAVSVLSAGGGNQPTLSPRSTSLVSSPPSLPAVTRKVAAPSPRPHPRAHHPRRHPALKRDARDRHSKKSERKTTHVEAPVDSSASVPVTILPAPSSVSVAVPEPPSPSPPPQSGGSSGGRAEFSFER